MRLLCFLILIQVCFTGYSQTTETKKVTSGIFKEIYSVEKKTKVKNGTYVKIEKLSKDTLIVGQYQNNQRSGVWKYFSEGNKLWMSYDFDKKAFALIPDEIKNITQFNVSNGSEYTEQNVDNPPIYLASKKEIEFQISSEIIPVADIVVNSKSGLCIARFVIDKTGHLKDIVPEVMMSDVIFPQMKSILEDLKEPWIPAKMNGQEVDSQYILVLDIKPEGKPLFEDNPKCIVVHYSYLSKPIIRTTVSLGTTVVTTNGMPPSDAEMQRLIKQSSGR
jgi:hypothetical protein